MKDLLLTCSRCQSPFVYSVYEQTRDQRENKPAPTHCPICSAIVSAETKHPPKPKIQHDSR